MSMFSNWTVGRRLVAGFGLSALTLVVIAVVSYRNAYLLIENDAWVSSQPSGPDRSRGSCVRN